ncbi:MAG: adenine deaminase [Chloroflexi bacterium]|nr:adenine deaminase [Chloroflexota bacterium]
MNRQRLIQVARGSQPADLVLTNARILNVFNGEVERGNVALAEGRVAGIGDYTQGKRVVDLGGRYLAPGFIDGHVHLESSYLDVPQYARAVVPRGTTTVVTDLHEVVNVCGLRGMRYYIEAARRLPLDVFFMAPSCVPCSPLETSGAALTARELGQAMRWGNVIGLGEMMNFPGVLFTDAEVLAKVDTAHRLGRPVDGHSPGLSGKDLQGYVAAGIYSDHECIHLEEAREKLARGMHIMIREGSSEKNLEELLPVVTDSSYPRCLFVVDDRTCLDILQDGDMDAVVRKAIACGLDPVRAVRLASLNTAQYFGLPQRGAVAPGYLADLIVVEDLNSFRVSKVFKAGKLVAEDGRAVFKTSPVDATGMTDTVHLRPLAADALTLPAGAGDFPVIGAIPGQIVTRYLREEVRRENGHAAPDPARDQLKIVVAERHHATGNVGRGLIRGFGLKRGAIASTVAHDSHNIMVVGASDGDILAAIREIERMGGGLVVTAEGKVLESLALPIAGLLSPAPLEEAATKVERLQRLAAELGCALPSPFATLSFMALPVIPELKLTDRGLVDVTKFEFVYS